MNSPVFSVVSVDADSILDCSREGETLVLSLNVLFCEEFKVEMFTSSDDGEMTAAVVPLVDGKTEVEFKADMFKIEDEIDATMEM